MSCAKVGCTLGSKLAMTACSVCGRGVHHICSNEFYGNGDLSERYCSQPCADSVHPPAEPASTTATTTSTTSSGDAEINSVMVDACEFSMTSTSAEEGYGHAGSDDSGNECAVLDVSIVQEIDLAASDNDSDNNCDESMVSAEVAEDSADECTVEGTAVSAATSTTEKSGDEMPKTGIPSRVLHSRSSTSRDAAWDLVHELSVHEVIHGQTFRHICLLCVEDAIKQANATSDAWMKGLCNMTHVSNVKLHLQRIHKEHRLTQDLFRAAEKKAATKFKRAQTEKHTREATSTKCGGLTALASGEDETTARTATPLKKRRVDLGLIEKHFRPKRESIMTALAEWLVSDGLPYSLVATDGFKAMLREVTGYPNLTVLARDTYNSAIDGRFSIFKDTVSALLKYQHDRLHGMKYLTLIHDAWTCNKSTGIIGASVAFIDHQWSFRHIALVAATKNDGHSSEDVADLIARQCLKHYGLDIRALTKWTMSDTTSSARAVAAFYDDSMQEDCRMHILNLCIGYGIGLKENVKTIRSLDCPSTKVKQVITPGGPLPEGADVIRKLRALNNYFNTPKRMDKLTKIQELHGFPLRKPLLDVEVRVASACRLMRRSILNFAALRMYFMDQAIPNVFSVINESDWNLIREMEAVTQYLADIALSEVQAQNLLSSYMLVFRTMAEAHLKSRSFKCLVLTTPSSTKPPKQGIREDVLVDNFTVPGKICIARCLAQVRNRFPQLTKFEAVSLLLDPRTKNCAGDIIDGMGSANAHRDNLLKQAQEFIIEEHVKLVRLQHAKRVITERVESRSQVTTQSARIKPASSARPHSTVLFGAPVPSKTKQDIQENRLREEAGIAFRAWLDHQEDWAGVAMNHGAKADHATLSNELCFKLDDDTICWNIAELCKIDVLRWFREVGQSLFPTISTLARVWLGKVSSTAFQERVFSTAGIVMSDKRSRTDHERAEKQLLMRVNRHEIDC